MDEPRKPSNRQIRRRLEAFEQSAIEDRARRHAELAVFARLHPIPNLEERHAQIDEIEPWEAKAFEVLARGVDPAQGVNAFIQQFVANSYGDPERGLPTHDPTPE